MKIPHTAGVGFGVLLIAAAIVFAARPLSPPHKPWLAEIVYRVPTDQRVVALTFDDGPHPKFTPRILDILDKYDIKATFFMVGKEVARYPDVVKDVVRRGHAIGNHTYTHPHNIELDTRGQVVRELSKCEDAIERTAGIRPHLFRPPRGLVDGTVFSVANDEGYRVILWTVSADHHDAPTPRLMAKRVLQHIKPGGVILAHDGMYCSRIKDVEATPLIIEELVKQGYRFVTIPELLRIAEERAARTPSAPGAFRSARYSLTPAGTQPNRR